MSEPSKKAWHKLDNAAKIFPPTSSKSDTRVFRFSCELFEEVEQDILQQALDRTMNDFPSFRYVLKRGMFWYYLEQSEIRPIVRIEDTPPCATVYLGQKRLLFDVTWYRRRINLEVYHVLTDGTGAQQFLKMLTLHYLKLAHPDTMGKVSGIDYDASDTQKMNDSFNKYYDRSKNINTSKKTSENQTSAYQIKSTKEAEWRLNIIEGIVSAKALLNKAHEYETTVTIFITSMLIRAIYDEMNVQDRKKTVVITVPVNLRNYFDSKSARNFFSLVDIKYNFHNGKGNLEDIIKQSKECFAEYLNEEYLQSRLNKLISFERNYFIRPIPLAIKNIFMHFAYSFSARKFTASVSNMGKISVPNEAKQYIKLFDIFTATDKLQICICSYEDNMNISFTSPFVNKDIQREFFRQLTKMGIEVEISANNLKGE